MKVSGFRFLVITILILLIPIYGNWKLFLYGVQAEGVVIKTNKESMGQLLSFYSIIEYQVGENYYQLKGPENIEYPIGNRFSVLYQSQKPTNSIILNLRGVYLNKFTAVSLVLFILWVAFYLSFSPKRENRKSRKEQFKPNGYFRKRKLT